MDTNKKKGGVEASRKGNANAALLKNLIQIYKQPAPPSVESMMQLCATLLSVYETEAESVRPKDDDGLPGGIVYLFPDIPTIIIPDLHARTDFFLSTMLFPFAEGRTALDMLHQGILQIVCLGDGFHAEGRRAARWKRAFEEFKGGYHKHKHMDDEMRESLGVMEMVLEMKEAFPLRFHFLKGNHENISNENGGGNYPFRKYAYEGAMVLEYVKKFYGDEFLSAYYQIEKNFPLLAVGGNFIISHAEPKKLFKANKVVNYRTNANAVYGLTWTDNEEAAEGSVRKMIEHYLPEEAWDQAKYFGGHRPVAGLYQTRANGQYVQIHNPQGFQAAYCRPYEAIDEETCMIEIPDISGGV